MASVAKRKWTHAGVKKEAWVVRYFDDTGARRAKTFELKKDADAYRRQVEREIEDGLHTARTVSRTVKEVAAEYLSALDAKVRDGRIGRAYCDRQVRIVEQKILPELSSILMTDLTPAMVERFYDRMTGAYKLAPITAKWQVYGLLYLEKFAMKRGYTKRLATSEALADLGGIAPSRIRTFTANEIAILFSTAAKHRHGLRPRPELLTNVMIHLGALCGLRHGEILALTMENVDIEGRLIKVRHSLTEFDTLKGPKTLAGRRTVPMPARVADLLREWIERYYIPNSRGLIFRTESGRALSQANLNKPWRRLLRDAGLEQTGEQFHFHALRHFAASWMIENGIPITDVAALLGHSKFDVTLQVYAHPVMKPHMRHDAIERLTTFLPDRDAKSLTHRSLITA